MGIVIFFVGIIGIRLFFVGFLLVGGVMGVLVGKVFFGVGLLIMVVFIIFCFMGLFRGLWRGGEEGWVLVLGDGILVFFLMGIRFFLIILVVFVFSILVVLVVGLGFLLDFVLLGMMGCNLELISWVLLFWGVLFFGWAIVGGYLVLFSFIW